MATLPVRRWKVCEVDHPIVRLFHTLDTLAAFTYVGYGCYVGRTRSSPQVGDVVEIDDDHELIALSLDQESPV